MTALEFLQDNLEDITFLCQLNNNEKDFKDIQLFIKHLLNDHKEFTRISQVRQAGAARGLRHVMDDLDEMIMDVLYDIATGFKIYFLLLSQITLKWMIH